MRYDDELPHVNLYDKPNFGLIIKMFFSAIVIILVAGVLFVCTGTLHMTPVQHDVHTSESTVTQ